MISLAWMHRRSSRIHLLSESSLRMSSIATLLRYGRNQLLYGLLLNSEAKFLLLIAIVAPNIATSYG